MTWAETTKQTCSYTPFTSLFHNHKYEATMRCVRDGVGFCKALLVSALWKCKVALNAPQAAMESLHPSPQRLNSPPSLYLKNSLEWWMGGSRPDTLYLLYFSLLYICSMHSLIVYMHNTWTQRWKIEGKSRGLSRRSTMLWMSRQGASAVVVCLAACS